MNALDTPFATLLRRKALATIIAPEASPQEPALLELGRVNVNAVIGSLALGGAERILLDWGASCASRYRVRIVVLRDVQPEWPVPSGLEITRLGGKELIPRLERVGAAIAAAGNPLVLCHMLTEAERHALTRGGAYPVPVLHNASEGWIEPADALSDSRCVIAVSRTAAKELRARGCRTPCVVIHHIPGTPTQRPDARREWRLRWALPHDALVIGMIGAVKPQKAYPRALRVLAALVERRNAYLVILGGPVGRDGVLAWRAVLAQAMRLGMEERVRLPGFVPNAADCLPAFDLLLNTSRYEGLSIATLEALAAGLPVVASDVGGQGEIPAPGLALLPFAAPDVAWARAVDTALRRRPALPRWRGFPTHRLWTLLHLLGPCERGADVLFVTASLNAGGAQRSLVNLALALKDSLRFEIAVCGSSSSGHFSHILEQAGLKVYRSAASRDCFDHAEAILRRIVAGRFGTVCFWNVDAKVKLVLAKVLVGVAKMRLVDVSPGGYGFEEMRATQAFQEWIAFSEDEYYARLDRLVLKYHCAAPEAATGKVSVIPNGVVGQGGTPIPAAAVVPRVVVSGRIAPSKFLIEAVAAMRVLWRKYPHAELHLLGRAEQRHAAYAQNLLNAIGPDLGARVFLHGAVSDTPQRLAGFSVALVLGEHQGCPNAVLEALAAGLPVIANDSGGTRELVIDGRTGLLLPGCDPREIAAALAQVIGDPVWARRLSEAGQRHVARRFSMSRMAAAYRKLFRCA